MHQIDENPSNIWTKLLRNQILLQISQLDANSIFFSSVSSRIELINWGFIKVNFEKTR